LGIIFLIIPWSLSLSISPIIKLSSVLIGLIYIAFLSIKLKLFVKHDFYALNGRKYWKYIALIFAGIIISSWIFVANEKPQNLFVVVKKSPALWLGILIFYALLSAYPQEIIYRGFFFKRYESLFNSKWILVGINLIIFPVAHLMFNNTLVLIVTFIGGIFFALSYLKTKSIMLTSIEHAMYGNWIFTIGMGEMLAFPMPN
jgi:membrane protease YdiL (CAAX protease family)